MKHKRLKSLTLGISPILLILIWNTQASEKQQTASPDTQLLTQHTKPDTLPDSIQTVILDSMRWQRPDLDSTSHRPDPRDLLLRPIDRTEYHSRDLLLRPEDRPFFTQIDTLQQNEKR